MATACIPQITFGFEPKGKPIVAASTSRTPVRTAGRSC
jgi:hypothetical protein